MENTDIGINDTGSSINLLSQSLVQTMAMLRYFSTDDVRGYIGVRRPLLPFSTCHMLPCQHIAITLPSHCRGMIQFTVISTSSALFTYFLAAAGQRNWSNNLTWVGIMSLCKYFHCLTLNNYLCVAEVAPVWQITSQRCLRGRRDVSQRENISIIEQWPWNNHTGLNQHNFSWVAWSGSLERHQLSSLTIATTTSTENELVHKVIKQ